MKKWLGLLLKNEWQKQKALWRSDWERKVALYRNITSFFSQSRNKDANSMKIDDQENQNQDNWDYEEDRDYVYQDDLHARVAGLEEEVDELREDSRQHRYDVDDEFQYMNDRTNRKFQDIEDDIEDLYERKEDKE